MGSKSMRDFVSSRVGLSSLLMAGAMMAIPVRSEAMTCYGIEARIIATDDSVGASITAHITAAFQSFNAMLTTQFQELVSAQKALTAQESVSGDQVSTMAVRAAEAAASADAQVQQNQQIREANDEFQSTGYNACGLESSMQQFYSSYETAFSTDPSASIRAAVANAPGNVGSPSAWFSSVKSGANTSAASLFNGNMSQATQYINTIMGPPVQYKTTTRDAASGLFQSAKATNDARRGAALYVLSSIAKEHAAEGPQAAMEAVISQYVGDGGERWTAAMAGSHRRGILLDAARLEAANVAQEAYAVRKTQRTELAVASYVLSRASNLLQGDNAPTTPARGQ